MPWAPGDDDRHVHNCPLPGCLVTWGCEESTCDPDERCHDHQDAERCAVCGRWTYVEDIAFGRCVGCVDADVEGGRR